MASYSENGSSLKAPRGRCITTYGNVAMPQNHGSNQIAIIVIVVNATHVLLDSSLAIWKQAMMVSVTPAASCESTAPE